MLWFALKNGHDDWLWIFLQDCGKISHCAGTAWCWSDGVGMIRENSIKEFLLILSLEDRSYKTLHTNDIFQILTELVTIFLQEYYQFVALLNFVAFLHVASLLSIGVDNKKVGVDYEKALELTNSTVFHRGRPWKSSRAGQQNIFLIFQPDFN